MSKAFLTSHFIGYAIGKQALAESSSASSSSSFPTPQGDPFAVIEAVYTSKEALSDYIGEKVSQLEHALQAGRLARLYAHNYAAGNKNRNAPPAEELDEDAILASLFHDVGHLIPHQEQMTGNLGVVNHERLGAGFLQGLGFSRKTCELVRRHVDAKRYLCWKHPAYYQNLSEASKGTLALQGGKMGDKEAREFEADPLFSLVIAMRSWDEEAKVPVPTPFLVPSLPAYQDMITRCCLRGWARDAYDRDGFVVLRSTLTESQKKDLVAWCDEIQAWEPTPGRHMVYYETINGVETLCRTENFLPYHTGLRNLITKGEVKRVLDEVLGDDAVVFKEKINYKLSGGGGFPPHQDAPAFTAFGQKHHLSLNIAIDAATPENGCLEVAPGRHKEGLFPQNASDGSMTAEIEATMNWISVPLQPGDVLLFSSWLPHRSGRNNTTKSRRALYITYNGKNDGDFREDYYKEKRLHFPQKVERDPTKDYSEGAKIYNLATPITN